MRAGCGACAEARESDSRLHAHACNTMAADEFEDARQCLKLLDRRQARTEVVGDAVGRFREDIKRQIFNQWSDHFPICAWL